MPFGKESTYNELEKAEIDFQTKEDMLSDLGVYVIWYKGGDEQKELPILFKHLITKSYT